MSGEKATLLTITRLIIGVVLMGAMGYTWVFIKEFELWLFAIPAALMGVNPFDFLKSRK